MAVSPTYGGGIAGDDYVPTTITELGEMIGKIAYAVLWDNTAINHLSIFNKGKIDNGDTIEQAVVEMAESLAYDEDGATTLDRETTTKLAVKYFKNWTRKVFKKTIDVPQLRLVLEGNKDASDVSAKIVSSMTEGETQEEYENLRDLLLWGRQVADGGTGATLVKFSTVNYDAINDSIDYNGVLKAIKNAVKGMTFVNDDFNTISLKRRTRKEDIVIVAPYQLITDLDVDSLASFFNLDKAEIKDRIIEVDTGKDASGFYDVFIVDKHAVLEFTRLYEMVNQLNAEGLFWNYYLHVSRLFALCPLFDACYVRVATQA